MGQPEDKSEFRVMHITPQLQASARHLLDIAKDNIESTAVENMLSLMRSLVNDELSDSEQSLGFGPMVSLYIHIVGFMASAQAIHEHFDKLNEMADVKAWQHALVEGMASIVKDTVGKKKPDGDSTPPKTPDTLN